MEQKRTYDELNAWIHYENGEYKKNIQKENMKVPISKKIQYEQHVYIICRKNVRKKRKTKKKKLNEWKKENK